jgi:hypothetical protein
MVQRKGGAELKQKKRNIKGTSTPQKQLQLNHFRHQWWANTKVAYYIANLSDFMLHGTKCPLENHLRYLSFM